MNVPSSISNFDVHVEKRQVPSGMWLYPLAFAVAVALCFVTWMEYRLDQKGFRATIVDSDAEWMKQRRRASDLGSKALVIVGASRAQLDIDLSVLRQRTGLEPVQLALDGSSALPVLRGLAEDDRISGTVLVDFQPADINSRKFFGQSELFESEWDKRKGEGEEIDFASTERELTDYVRTHLRSYADGASPLTSLLVRIVNRESTPQYLRVLPTREGLADYRRVKMPNFYFLRVARDLETEGGDYVDIQSASTWQQLADAFQANIVKLNAAKPDAFGANTQDISRMVDRIRGRGGRVIFVFMPTSGLVHEILDRRYPREEFWNRFAESVNAASFNSNDFSQFREFECPDGSHLDFRDKTRFTAVLADMIWPQPLQ